MTKPQYGKSMRNKNLSVEIAKWIPDAYSPARKMGRRGESESFETDKLPAGYREIEIVLSEN
jgi:hypothetical protein